MKTAKACKLFGAHKALMGIRDGVVLFHSVVGCNYGTMSFHLAPCSMTDVRQTCTVLSDDDIVFSGEASLRRALRYTQELYEPNVIFVVTGCVSDIIQDDVRTVSEEFQQECGVRTIVIEAAGYRGDTFDGYEAALEILLSEIKAVPKIKQSEHPVINLIGLGADDVRLKADIQAMKDLLNEKAELGVCLADCTMEQIHEAGNASLNLVFGEGIQFAEKMKQKYNIPYVCMEFPYGFGGAQKLWDVLGERFGLDYSQERRKFRNRIKERLSSVYTYLQALYGIPVAVIGVKARAKGMADFLSDELGMEVEVLAYREDVGDLEDFYDRVMQSEAALICGSSFEQELADRMELPLFRFDFPVFDRVCLFDRPYVGEKGILCLIEDLLNEIFVARTGKGALYQ